LTRATGVTVTAVYTYNGDGLRVAQAVNGVETWFTWDQAAARPQVVATSGGQTAQYLYGRELLGVQQGGQGYSPLADALGSLRQWTDAAGAGVGSASYDPFGGVLSQQGFTSPWGFAGEYHDPLTGLQYLRARWYQPGVGRFTQVDPFPGIQTLPLTQNPYVYAGNNPVRYTDPDGKLFLEALGTGLAAGGVAAAIKFALCYAQRAPGHSFNETLNLVWQCDSAAIANVFVSGFLSTLLYSLFPWSSCGLVGRLVWGAVIGGATSVLGDVAGRWVEYELSGKVPVGTYSFDTYLTDFGWGAFFGLIGQVVGISYDDNPQEVARATNSKWYNQNPYRISKSSITERRFPLPWDIDLEDGHRILRTLADEEVGGSALFRVPRGWPPMNNQADAIAALYESGFSSASYIFGLRPVIKGIGDWFLNSTAWPLVVPQQAQQKN